VKFKINQLILTLVVSICFLFEGQANAALSNNNQQLCSLTFQLDNQVKTNRQKIQLNKDMSMQLSNAVSVKVVDLARIASNTGCQQLTGASYTGSQAEWQKFFDSAVKGLLKAEYKELSLTFIGDNEKVFTSVIANKFDVKEYTLKGNADGNKQIIKNLAMLDKKTNSLYTFSVSGNEIVAAEIDKEFKRLVSSIKSVN